VTVCPTPIACTWVKSSSFPTERAGVLIAACWAILLLGGCGKSNETAAPTAGGANQNGESRVSSRPEQASFEFRPANVDLGLVPPEQPTSVEFEIVNTGAEPLRFVEVKGSCGCLGIAYDHRELEAGGSLKLSTSLRLVEAKGAKLMTVWAIANDTRHTRKEMTIEYRIAPRMSFNPPKIAFGRRSLGQSTLKEVKVVYYLPSGEELKPITTSVENLPITVEEVGEPATSPFGEYRKVSRTMIVHLDASKEVASFNTQIRFETSLRTDSTLPISGEVHPGWYLDQRKIYLGDVFVGEKRSRKISFCHTLGDDLKIEELGSSAPELSARALDKVGVGTIPIEITLEGRTVGTFTGTIEIRINRSTEPLCVEVFSEVKEKK